MKTGLRGVRPSLPFDGCPAARPRLVKAGFSVNRWTGFLLLGCGALTQELAGQMARATKKNDTGANPVNDGDRRGKLTMDGERITSSPDRDLEIAP